MSEKNIRKAESAGCETEKREFTGIFVPADVARSTALTDTAKFVYGLVSGLSKDGRPCNASNEYLAGCCGSTPSTVSRALSQLEAAGRVRIETGRGGRRVIACCNDRDSGLPETQAGLSNQQGGLSNQQGGLSNPQGDLIYKINNIEDESSSVGSVSESDCQSEPRAAFLMSATAAASTPEIFREWCLQVTSLMVPREWDGPDRKSGGSRRFSLGIPVAVIPRPCDARRFEEIAQGFWPGADKASAVRHLLRSCSRRQDQRDVIQQYVCGYRQSRLSLANLMAIGKRGDEGRFLADAATVSEPLASAPAGAQALAAVLRTMCYVSGRPGAWERDADAWAGCFAEAAGRCDSYLADPSLYAACAYSRVVSCGDGTPMPWVMSELTRAEVDAFRDGYGRDRLNAWTCGPLRRKADSSHIPNICNVYRICAGALAAAAAAAGATAFKSRSCLKCAALELETLPALAGTVEGWGRSAAELVDRLNALAAATAEDVPPLRGEECGQHDQTSGVEPSLKRCWYGNAPGLYRPEQGIAGPVKGVK